MTGVGPLLMHQFRRDRVFVAVWVYGLLAMVGASAYSIRSLYPALADRVHAAEGLNSSPAIVALYGPILDVQSKGELAMTKTTVTYAVLVALMAVFLVRRHTRLAEERGQLELVGATGIGRDAPLAAALLEATIVALVLGGLAAVTNAALGLPVLGSMLFGASWAGTALVGAALGAATAQLSASARTCASIAAAVLAVWFGMRAVGDTTPAGWLGWLSPLGWNTRLRAWSEPRYWVLLLYVVLAVVLVGVAVVLHARRDLGAGLVADRPGPATGRIGSVLPLTVRVHRSLIGWWTLGVAVSGLLFGAISPNLGGIFTSPGARAMIEALGGRGKLAEVMLAAMFSIGAVIVTCFAITVLAHATGDETVGRGEEVLATGASRTRLYVALLAVSLVGTTWLLVVMGVGATIGFGAVGSGWPLLRFVGAALGQAPSVWLVSSLAVLLYGLRSRWSAGGWALVGGFLVLGQVAAMLKMPSWIGRVSPYEQAPRLPGGTVSWTVLTVMTGLAVAALLAGWWRFRERDIG